MHHQNEFLVFVFLVIAIRTCHTLPRPQNVDNPVVDVAKETEYEEHRDADLQESINAGQSGRALLFPYNGILAIELNDRPKRQDDEATNIETTTEEISESKLPESYAGRFEGLDIGNILSIAGAEPQAFTRGEASYGRKRRNAGEEEEIITDDEDDVVSETTTEKTESKLPESYAGRFKGLNIANILSIAGAKPQAFTRGEASYGRKRRNAGEEEEEDVEAKNEEIPDAMADQMTEIENVQALWLEFLQHGISSRRKRQEEAKEITGDGENVLAKNEEIPDSMAFQLEDIENVQALWLEFLQHGISSRRKRQEEAKEITGENVEDKNEEIPDAMADQMAEIENVQTLWLEFLQHGISSRRKRQNLQFEIEATENQDKVDPNTKISVPIQVKVKNWGETGIKSQVAGDNRKKRQSLEFLEEANTQDNDVNINANTKKAVPIQVKNWGETGIQSQNVNNRKKRQSLEFLEDAIENESIMQEIFQATDDLNAIVIPIKIVEVKNWGETGIQKPSESI